MPKIPEADLPPDFGHAFTSTTATTAVAMMPVMVAALPIVAAMPFVVAVTALTAFLIIAASAAIRTVRTACAFLATAFLATAFHLLLFLVLAIILRGSRKGNDTKRKEATQQHLSHPFFFFYVNTFIPGATPLVCKLTQNLKDNLIKTNF